MVELGTTSSQTHFNCWVYDYYSVTPPSSCAAPGTSGADNGNVLSEFYQDTANPSLQHSEVFQYDSLNRLSDAGASGSVSYHVPVKYDQYGNATCDTTQNPSGPACANVTFDTSTNRMTAIGSATPTYDAAGDLTSDGTCSYTWDAEQRITSVSACATFTMTYNALGQLAET
jgi:hypothetical protein